MTKPTANSVFVKGVRYMFSLWTVILLGLLTLSISLRSGTADIKGVLIAYSLAVLLALVLSLISVYPLVKKAVDKGETSDKNIWLKNGKLKIF